MLHNMLTDTFYAYDSRYLLNTITVTSVTNTIVNGINKERVKRL